MIGLQIRLRAGLQTKVEISSKFQNVTVPIIQPQVQASLSYFQNVFLTGYPIFGVNADPSNEDAALQMETIVGENSTTKGWARQLSMFFRDGLKYNLCALECDWQQETNWTIKSDPQSSANGGRAEKILWQGNVVKRLDLYNTFWDPRVHPTDMHLDGEFAGYTELYSRSRFKKFVNSLYNKVPVAQAVAALNSQAIQGDIGADSTAPFGYYQPIINPYPFFQRQGGFDWMSWATNSRTAMNGASYSNIFSVTKFYARIIPKDFDLKVPEKNTPQVWRFIIVNAKVILCAERMSNVHNFIPILFCQPIEDGLDYQTKSFASNVSDLQYVGSAMWNGYLANKQTGDDLMQTILQVLGSSQQLAAGYNLAPMFTYMLKPQGLDLTPFQKSPEQLQYEQALQAWQQAAELAAKNKSNFSTPMPQPSPQLQQQMQQGTKGGNPAVNTPPQVAANPTVPSEDILTKAVNGDVAAFKDVLNKAVQLGFAQATSAAGEISKNHFTSAQNILNDQILPQAIRTNQINEALSVENNPAFKDPSVAPMVSMVAAQLQSKYPTSPASEIATMAKGRNLPIKFLEFSSPPEILQLQEEPDSQLKFKPIGVNF
ncbi:unnamed protein product [Sphagnum jensenii]